MAEIMHNRNNRTIDSKVLKETRKLLIKHPQDYYSSDKAFPR